MSLGGLVLADYDHTNITVFALTTATHLVTRSRPSALKKTRHPKVQRQFSDNSMAPLGGSTSTNGLILMGDARRQQPIPVWVWVLIAISVSWLLASLFMGYCLLLVCMSYCLPQPHRMAIIQACAGQEANAGHFFIERVRKDFNMPVRYGRVVLLWLRWLFLITPIQIGLNRLGWRTGDCCGGWCTAECMRRKCSDQEDLMSKEAGGNARGRAV